MAAIGERGGFLAASGERGGFPAAAADGCGKLLGSCACCSGWTGVGTPGMREGGRCLFRPAASAGTCWIGWCGSTGGMPVTLPPACGALLPSGALGGGGPIDVILHITTHNKVQLREVCHFAHTVGAEFSLILVLTL